MMQKERRPEPSLAHSSSMFLRTLRAVSWATSLASRRLTAAASPAACTDAAIELSHDICGGRPARGAPQDPAGGDRLSANSCHAALQPVLAEL